jgi:lipid-A-disaccharide synthase-like uncharacterized protein
VTNTFDGLLTKAAHGSSGVFTGFTLPTFANFLMAHAMVRNKVFSSTTSYIGLIGNFLMLLYYLLSRYGILCLITCHARGTFNYALDDIVYPKT